MICPLLCPSYGPVVPTPHPIGGPRICLTGSLFPATGSQFPTLTGFHGTFLGVLWCLPLSSSCPVPLPRPRGTWSVWCVRCLGRRVHDASRPYSAWGTAPPLYVTGDTWALRFGWYPGHAVRYVRVLGSSMLYPSMLSGSSACWYVWYLGHTVHDVPRPFGPWVPYTQRPVVPPFHLTGGPWMYSPRSLHRGPSEPGVTPGPHHPLGEPTGPPSGEVRLLPGLLQII